MRAMTAQALAGVLAGATITLLGLYSLLWHRWRADVRAGAALVEVLEERIADERRTHRADLERRAEAGARASGELELERRMRLSAETRLEEVELELARRRHGPILEGETVALTTPDDRTIRGVVRQTFDNGAVLLGAAIVYVERQGRDRIEVDELAAGDVVVPEHRWAQKLPPDAPTPED